MEARPASLADTGPPDRPAHVWSSTVRGVTTTVLGGLILLASAGAAASSLTVSSRSLVAADGTVVPCQTSAAITPTWTTTRDQGLNLMVTAVTLSPIDTRCHGKPLVLVLTAGAAVAATWNGTASSPAVTAALATPVRADTLTAWSVLITG